MDTSGVARLWSQGGHRGLGPQRSPRAEPRWGSGGQIYTNNLQLSNAFLCRFVAESVPRLSISPYPPCSPQILRICANCMTHYHHGQSRVGTCPPVATLLMDTDIRTLLRSFRRVVKMNSIGMIQFSLKISIRWKAIKQQSWHWNFQTKAVNR